MATVLNKKQYPCRIATTGIIHELGCISGPVPFCRLTNEQIKMLLMNGREVYEKCPDNLSVEVRLHVANPLQHPFETPEEDTTKESNPEPQEPEKEPATLMEPVLPESEPDLSKMSKKQKKEYYKKLAQEAKTSVDDIPAQENDPVTPDA